MKEVKPSKKPLAIYYAIVLLVLLVINLVVMPWLAERQVQEVDYGTFMSMTEQENIGKVDIQSNQIIFTDKDNKQIYKTGLMNDPGLTERLYDAGAQFSSEIVEQGSPVLSFLLWFVLPILLFSFIGNQMNKKLMEKAGGGPGAMMFGGAGKSNAKVYVQSTHGIRFTDVAGDYVNIRITVLDYPLSGVIPDSCSIECRTMNNETCLFFLVLLAVFPQHSSCVRSILRLIY